MARNHEVYTIKLDAFTYRGECKSCAKGSPPIHSYEALRAWVGTHTQQKCAMCHHAGSSHYSAGSNGAGCKTCPCARFRG